jgi:hypothetical protein
MALHDGQPEHAAASMPVRTMGMHAQVSRAQDAQEGPST